MERLGDYVKQSVLNFKLELCCFMASVRTGVLMLSCANVVLGFITLIALAEDTFAPVLMQALQGLSDSEDVAPNFKPPCIVAYAIELASSALLLCAIVRNDLVLLRFYLYYGLGVITAAIMVYSVIFFSVTIGVQILILASLVYQGYLILLVRSAMVEIKHASMKNGYTVNLKKNDIEASPGTGPSEKYSVVIESDRDKKAPVTVVKGDMYKAGLIKESEVKAGFDKEATLPVHLATRHVVTAKAGPTKEVTTPINLKEGTSKTVTKEVTATIHSTKEGTAKAVPTKEVPKEVKKEEIKKPSRSFFGKKKVKIEDSEAKLEKIDETKKV